MKNTITALSFFLALSSIAQAKTFNGEDKNGQPCGVSINNLSYGQTTMHSSCDFDMDGVGPWCSTEKNVPTAPLRGNGIYTTAHGSISFNIDDNYVRYDDPSYSFSATSSEGGTVVFNASNSQITVSYDFLTPYGASLGTQQRIGDLLHVPAGMSYQQVFDQIYSSEVCTIHVAE